MSGSLFHTICNNHSLAILIKKQSQFCMYRDEDCQTPQQCTDLIMYNQ